MTAKTLLGEDLLARVLAGVYTDVEKTMIELHRTIVVQETPTPSKTRCSTNSPPRSSASRAANVLAFISNHHVGHDIEIELFMLTPRNESEPRRLNLPDWHPVNARASRRTPACRHGDRTDNVIENEGISPGVCSRAGSGT